MMRVKLQFVIRPILLDHKNYKKRNPLIFQHRIKLRKTWLMRRNTDM